MQLLLALLTILSMSSAPVQWFWVGDKVAQEMYSFSWHPGQENLADYQSKHHPGVHHVAVCLWYLHMGHFPRVLPWALKPSTLKGCVGTLKDGYLQKIPLPRASRIQSTEHVTATAVTRVPLVTSYSQGPRVPTLSNIARLFVAGLSGCILLPPLFM
jgi:hypothetical protein